MKKKNLKGTIDRYKRDVKRAIKNSKKSYGVSKRGERPEDKTLDVLKMRYAKGEITRKKFELMKKDLKK